MVVWGGGGDGPATQPIPAASEGLPPLVIDGDDPMDANGLAGGEQLTIWGTEIDMREVELRIYRFLRGFREVRGWSLFGRS